MDEKEDKTNEIRNEILTQIEVLRKQVLEGKIDRLEELGIALKEIARSHFVSS